jgi:hypothetical protein
MTLTANMKQKVWAEIDDLPADDLERVYKLILLVKDEFIDLSGEERYLTPGWQHAEQDATEAHARSGLRAYDSVDEMLDDILSATGE